MQKHRRTLIAPLDVAGAYKKIERGLNELGEDVEFINFFPNWYEDPTSRCEFWEVKYARYQVLNTRSTTHSLNQIIYKSIFLFCSILFLIRAIKRYQVFIFTFGQTLLPYNLDLILLKRIFRKKIIAGVGHGSEARLAYLDGTWLDNNPELRDINYFKNLIRLSNTKLKRIQRIEKYADYIVGIPTTSHLLSRKFINKFSLGQPVDIVFNSKRNNKISSKVTVVHAPSDAKIKGTELIRKAIDSLNKEFKNIDYYEISGAKNQEVLKAIETADLVVDQLWSDVPMAMIGAESASLHVACITFGEATQLWQSLAQKIYLPLMGYFPTNEFENILRSYIVNEKLREKLADDQYKFVQTHWSSKSVAKNYLSVINDEVPDDWVMDPWDFNYHGGVGASIDVITRNAEILKKHFGESALYLNKIS